MLAEEIMLCHNCMFYIGAALLVISNHDEKFIRHLKKKNTTYMPFFFFKLQRNNSFQIRHFGA